MQLAKENFGESTPVKCLRKGGCSENGKRTREENDQERYREAIKKAKVL